MIREAIETGAADKLDAIAIAVRETGAIDSAREAAAAEARRAMAAIGHLPDNAWRDALLELPADLLRRRA